MKNFTTFLVESKQKLDVQSGTINYIDSSNLKKYLEVANKFLSDESRYVIDWLIKNNKDYISMLSNDKYENALECFYNNGIPKDESLKDLYKNIGILSKKGRLMEIPTFMTPEQFKAIISKEKSFDSIVLDLDSEKGRNEVAKKYRPLIYHVAKQWINKSNLSMDELVSAAYEGLVYAMKCYGKRTDNTLADDDKMANYTFGQYAAYRIRINILEAVKNESRTVRIPVSQQNQERKTQGHNSINNTVSGDKVVGKKNDDIGGKTLFDFIGSVDDSSYSIDQEDLQKLWKRVFKLLEDKFDKKIMDIWYSFNGLNGYEKLKNKELAAKYKITSSNITYYTSKVNIAIKKDKKIMGMLADIWELTKECLNDNDRMLSENEVIHIDLNDRDKQMKSDIE